MSLSSSVDWVPAGAARDGPARARARPPATTAAGNDLQRTQQGQSDHASAPAIHGDSQELEARISKFETNPKSENARTRPQLFQVFFIRASNLFRISDFFCLGMKPLFKLIVQTLQANPVSTGAYNLDRLDHASFADEVDLRLGPGPVAGDKNPCGFIHKAHLTAGHNPLGAVADLVNQRFRADKRIHCALSVPVG
jgi:hypothetical protein